MFEGLEAQVGGFYGSRTDFRQYRIVGVAVVGHVQYVVLLSELRTHVAALWLDDNHITLWRRGVQLGERGGELLGHPVQPATPAWKEACPRRSPRMHRRSFLATTFTLAHNALAAANKRFVFRIKMKSGGIGTSSGS